MIYAYETPEIKKHDGYLKIGYTERPADIRISEQTKTVDVEYDLKWSANAIYEDGSGESFIDDDFHKYLKKKGYKKLRNDRKTDWVKIESEEAKKHLLAFRFNRGMVDDVEDITVSDYTLRKEQEEAVTKTLDYFKSHKGGEFLWNVKPRYGKTLTSYDLAKKMGCTSVLVVTNRPAVSHSWYDDYMKFIGRESGVVFISDTPEMKREPYVYSRQEYINELTNCNSKYPINAFIEFESLQHIKGSVYGGGKHDKLEHIYSQNWDLLIIDECHEGIDTYKTDNALDKINRKFTLHMSGTAFKALANEKFSFDAIFNWTYADEQNAKLNWNGIPEFNPYSILPTISVFTYRMSDFVKDVMKTVRFDKNGEQYKCAFDLNEFFRVDNNGNFVYESSVDKFLDALTVQSKYPFSTESLREELAHTVWLLDRVNSARALYRKLKNHPVFSDYCVVLAIGHGETDDISYELGNDKRAIKKVKEAIAQNSKTITLTVGQLTTGVTIREWSAIMMLSNVRSSTKYFQSAFRVQNYCLINKGSTSHYRKENCYIFDFEPARAPIMYEDYANNLSSYAYLKDFSLDERKENIRKMLNFFPIIGEDENGEMIELNADSVLSLPCSIKAKSVALAGFMSNDLFKNLSNVFKNPSKVLELLNDVKELREVKPDSISTEEIDEIELDEDGNVVVSNEKIIEQQKDLFGDKIFEDLEEEISNSIGNLNQTFEEDLDEDDIDEDFDISKKAEVKLVDLGRVNKELDLVKKNFGDEVTKKVLTEIKKKSNVLITKSMECDIEKSIRQDVEKIVESKAINYRVGVVKKQEELKSVMMDSSKSDEEIKKFKSDCTADVKKLGSELSSDIVSSVNKVVNNATFIAVKEVEKKKSENIKADFIDEIRKKGRALLRAIPMFLLGSAHLRYTVEIKLSNLEQLFPAEDFKEYTGVSIETFCKLRDGDENIAGGIFDEALFDEAIKEFYKLLEERANWFDLNQKEDIYDIIPAQKTNQIYTPKGLVIDMADILEMEIDGCFDDPYRTFGDWYVKSGITITEIVKRLFNSPVLKEMFPDDKERLKHIFKNQIYACCPTEIIYQCVLNYVFGFDKDFYLSQDEHNIRCFNTIPSCLRGTLGEDLYEVFVEEE